MLAPKFTREELEHFAQIERPGVRIAKDLYAIARENFPSLNMGEQGCLTSKDIWEFAGNERLKDFLNENCERLACLAFRASNLFDLLLGLARRNTGSKVSFSDLATFFWLSKDINRVSFYEGNFQSLREGAGLNAAGCAFISGFVAGCVFFAAIAKSQIFLSPTEATVLGVVATIGMPLCLAMIGYSFGRSQADKYFTARIKRIDQILEHLERRATFLS
jgi:hypothetical protein